MNNEYLKTLWLLRFEKMRKVEEESAWKYQEILDQCLEHLPEDDGMIAKLKQLVKEEKAHMKLAETMIEICKNSHPEIGFLG